MKFRPLNRHLLVRLIENEEPEQSTTILVPDDYVKVKTPYEVYEILNVAMDCEKIRPSNIGQQVVVNNSMVEEIKVHGGTYYLLLENYVYGIFIDAENKQWQN